MSRFMTVGAVAFALTWPCRQRGLKVALLKDPLPVVALRGDTLALLEQAENAAGDPVHLLRRYRIESSRCEWSATAR